MVGLVCASVPSLDSCSSMNRSRPRLAAPGSRRERRRPVRKVWRPPLPLSLHPTSATEKLPDGVQLPWRVAIRIWVADEPTARFHQRRRAGAPRIVTLLLRVRAGDTQEHASASTSPAEPIQGGSVCSTSRHSRSTRRGIGSCCVLWRILPICPSRTIREAITDHVTKAVALRLRSKVHSEPPSQQLARWMLNTYDHVQMPRAALLRLPHSDNDRSPTAELTRHPLLN